MLLLRLSSLSLSPMGYHSPLSHRPCRQIPPVFAPRIPTTRPALATSFSLASSLHHPFSPISSAYRPCRRLPLAKATEEDDLSAPEEIKKTSCPSHVEIDNADTAAFDPSSRDEQDVATHETSSIRTVVLWVCAAVIFGVGLGLKDGSGKASEFFAGYLLEQSLSVDNLFVFVLVFKYFKVPQKYQNRVLSYGIAGAIFFRAVMILLGSASLQRFEAVNLLLASILLYSSYKLFSSDDEETDLDDNFIVKTCQKFIPVTAHYDGDRFITRVNGAWIATPLLLTVAVIELSDIAFAVDSIPAVFGVTRDPFIVFSSNLFAISGLRSLYVLISGSMSELEYLQPAIGVVLGFIGTKMIFDFFGYHIPTEVSLGLVATCLSTGVLLSILKRSDFKS